MIKFTLMTPRGAMCRTELRESVCGRVGLHKTFCHFDDIRDKAVDEENHKSDCEESYLVDY